MPFTGLQLLATATGPFTLKSSTVIISTTLAMKDKLQIRPVRRDRCEQFSQMQILYTLVELLEVTSYSTPIEDSVPSKFTQVYNLATTHTPARDVLLRLWFNLLDKLLGVPDRDAYIYFRAITLLMCR